MEQFDFSADWILRLFVDLAQRVATCDSSGNAMEFGRRRIFGCADSAEWNEFGWQVGCRCRDNPGPSRHVHNRLKPGTNRL